MAIAMTGHNALSIRFDQSNWPFDVFIYVYVLMSCV